MAKKYFDNHKLNVAIDFLFSSIETDKYLPIHDVIKLESGDTLPKHQMKEGNYFVYGGGGKTENQHNKFNLDFDTIGIGRVGARCGCVFDIEKKSWVTDNLLYVKDYDKRFSLNFLKHFLSYSNLNKYANNAMQPVISKTGIQSVKIPLLDFKKQSEIAQFIDEVENEDFSSVAKFPFLQEKFELLNKIDVLNSENDIQKNTLSQLRQSILQEAIQGKLTEAWRSENKNTEPASELLKRIKSEKEKTAKKGKISSLSEISESEIPFDLPQGWVWCRLGEIAQSLIGLTYKPTDISEKGTPVLRSNNIQESKLVLSDLVKVSSEVPLSKMAQKGDILICVRNGSKRLIGKVAKIDADGFSFGAFMSVLRTGIDTNYLFTFLLSDVFRNQIDDEKSTGINQLTQGILNNIVFPLPPTEEQQAIVTQVEVLLDKCNALQAEIENLNTHNNILLKAIFTETFATETI